MSKLNPDGNCPQELRTGRVRRMGPMRVTVHHIWGQGEKMGIMIWWQKLWVFFSGSICFPLGEAGWGDLLKA